MQTGVRILFLSLAAAAPTSGDMPRRGAPPSGPWNNDVRIYRLAADGRAERLGVFERAGVPTIARLRDGRLLAAFQHFPVGAPDRFDKIAAAISSDEGRTWSSPETIRFAGLPEGMMRPFDPTLVALPDGRVRLYFTGNYHRRPEESAPAIYSAVSSNGVDFVVESGARFAVEGRVVVDCAVVLHQGVFHLYAPDNGAFSRRLSPSDSPRLGVGYHAISHDGLTFSRLPDVRVDGARRWLGNAGSIGRGLVFWGTEDGGPPEPGGRRGGLWRAVSRDGQSWTDVHSVDAVEGADPAAVPLRDGSWLLLVTSPPVDVTSRRNGERPPVIRLRHTSSSEETL